MTPEQIDTITDGLANLSQYIDLPVIYAAAASGLLAAAAAATVAAGYWTFSYIAWASRQPGIRRHEHYVNHPANRARKEKP